MLDILQQQIAYYRARATEYDDWWYSMGRYDRGEALNQQWEQEGQCHAQAQWYFVSGRFAPQ